MNTLRLIVLLLSLIAATRTGSAQTTSQNSFTYQGRLNHTNGPANGFYDFTFALFGQPVGGASVSSVLVANAVPVSNGLFSVALEFPNAFTGANRWIEISVRTNGAVPYTPLSPRQLITAAPYAIKAKEAATVPAGSITGAMLADGAVSASKLSGGAALQNLLAGGTAAVTAGGVIMSDDPANAGLQSQGYVRVPNGELTLAEEKWTQFTPPAVTAEFIPPTEREVVITAGSEVIVLRFQEPSSAIMGDQVEVIRYNPATGEWSKGATSPVGAVAPGASAVWTGSQILLFGGETYRDVGSGWDTQRVYENKNAVLIYTPASNTWSAMPGTGAVPLGRRYHSAVWTGSRMVIWGGERVQESGDVFSRVHIRVDLNDGAAFNPANGFWTALSANGAPSARRGHTAVWTGSRMIVHGGTQNNRETYYMKDGYPIVLSATNVMNNGFNYNPANDTWAPIRSDSTAPRHAFAQTVWTGTEMYVAGGLTPDFITVDLGFGSIRQWEWIPTRSVNSYNPTADSWSFRGVPDATGTNVNGRRYGTLTWTGGDVVLAGGEGLNETNNKPYPRRDLQAYNVGNAGWRNLPMPPLLGGVNTRTAWISNRLVVIDGPQYNPSNFGYYYTNGHRAAYYPANNTWEILRNYFGPEPLKQDDPSVVWTGTDLIIWGGSVNGTPSRRGHRFNLASRTWREISTTNAPAARRRHSAVWTGSRMVVWGGDSGGDPFYPNTIFSDGGAYDPVTDRWEPISPAPFDPLFGDTFRRTGHKAVWTEYGMVVIGGSDGYNNQGQTFPWSIARLEPALTDGWIVSAVSNNQLLGRYYHGVATDGGRRIFLWGGQNETVQSPLGTGMLIDSFMLLGYEVSENDQPTPARYPSIAWNGKEFITWGGENGSGTPLGGGSKFDPENETWTPPQVGGPVLTTAFSRHVSVWTGTELLLWGGTSSTNRARYNPRNDAWTPMSAGPAMRQNASGAWSGQSMLLYLPALPTQGSVPELWQYTPPAKVYFYLKQ